MKKEKKQAVFIALYAESNVYKNYFKDDPQNSKIAEKLSVPTVLMLNRFDGTIGFLGGTVETGEELIVALEREFLEETGYQLTKQQLQEANYVCRHETPNITTHLYALKVDIEVIKKIFANQVNAEHFLAEGTLICPHFINYQNGINSFDNFIQNNFALTVKEEIEELILSLNWEEKYNLTSGLKKLQYDKKLSKYREELKKFDNLEQKQQEEFLLQALKKNEFEKFSLFAASINLKDDFLPSCMRIMTESNNIDALYYLKDNFSKYLFLDQADKYVQSLSFACMNGFVEVAKFFVENKTHLYRSNVGSLGFASISGNKELVQYLLGQNYEVGYRNNCALSCAVINGHTDIISLLVEHGADFYDNNGYIFNSAVTHGQINSLNFFVEYGLSLSELDKQYGLLMKACDYDQKEVIEYLINNGCTVASDMLPTYESVSLPETYKLLTTCLNKQHLEKDLYLKDQNKKNKNKL